MENFVLAMVSYRAEVFRYKPHHRLSKRERFVPTCGQEDVRVHVLMNHAHASTSYAASSHAATNVGEISRTSVDVAVM